MPSTVISPLGFAFGGPADWAIIFVVALIVFGPKKLPEVGQQLGKALREFRKMADEITGATQSIHEEISSAAGQLRTEVEAANRTITAPVRTEPRTYDQPEVDPMAPAPQLTKPVEAPRTTGLKLSTNPEANAQAEAEPKG